MRHAILLLFLVCCLSIQAQIRDIPTQAEFDPILENGDRKLKDFVGTLTKYRVEATALDKERLEKDLHDYQQLREMIEMAHSGTGRHGINVARIFSIVAGLDDAALDAATWSNLLTAKICGPHQQSDVLFALAVQSNAAMLRELSDQLFHPGFRMASAADEVMLAIAQAKPNSKREH
jgi:hypothetical protein